MHSQHKQTFQIVPTTLLDILMLKLVNRPMYPFKFILANQRHISSVSSAYWSEDVQYDFGLISNQASNMARNALHTLSTLSLTYTTQEITTALLSHSNQQNSPRSVSLSLSGSHLFGFQWVVYLNSTLLSLIPFWSYYREGSVLNKLFQP